MRVLVCGGRNYSNTQHVYATLDMLHAQHRISVIIEGGATGADTRANKWANERGLACESYHADWINNGMAAGPIRNQRMIDEGKPDLCVAFPGGRGTADMVSRAKRAGVRVIEVEP